MQMIVLEQSSHGYPLYNILDVDLCVNPNSGKIDRLLTLVQNPIYAKQANSTLVQNHIPAMREIQFLFRTSFLQRIKFNSCSESHSCKESNSTLVQNLISAKNQIQLLFRTLSLQRIEFNSCPEPYLCIESNLTLILHLISAKNQIHSIKHT